MWLQYALSLGSNSQEVSYKEFVLGHDVNDVEEHFRRSLEQFNNKSTTASCKDVHQIIVTENTPQHSETPSPALYSPTLVARGPSNGATVGVAKTQQVLLSNGHDASSKQSKGENYLCVLNYNIVFGSRWTVTYLI